MPCITHHYACECRERRMELLEAVAKAAKNEALLWNEAYCSREDAEKISQAVKTLEMTLDALEKG